MSLTICPYLLKPISSDKLSKEHVIPFAIGGPSKFSVDADRDANNNFGAGLDGDFVNDDLMKAAAMFYKIVTRSGPAKLQVKGELRFETSKIVAAIEHAGDGRTTVHPDVPVVKINDGFEIMTDQSQFDKLVRATLKNNAKKDNALHVTNTRVPEASFQGRISHSQWAKTKGLLKIGYLALAYTFGDEFVLSEAGSAFRKGVDSKTEDELDQSGLDNLKLLFNKSTPTESPRHLVAAVRLGSSYGVYVSLFGNQVFTRQFSFPTGLISFQGARGEVYEVDAVKKRLSSVQFDFARHN